MLNKVHLIGNLGNDPVLKNFDSGKSVTEFRLATTERWKNKAGEWQERTEWHNIVLWGKTAEVAAEYLKKGSRIYIGGRVSYKSWEDDQGTKKYKTEIVADRMQMLDSKSSANASETTAKTDEVVVNTGEAVASTSDDLPF